MRSVERGATRTVYESKSDRRRARERTYGLPRTLGPGDGARGIEEPEATDGDCMKQSVSLWSTLKTPNPSCGMMLLSDGGSE